jgi:hypothetical protein
MFGKTKTQNTAMYVTIAPVETVTETVTAPAVGLTNGYTRNELRSFSKVLAKRACRRKTEKAAIKDLNDAIGYLEQLRDNIEIYGPTPVGARPAYSDRELFLLSKLLTKRAGHRSNGKKAKVDLRQAGEYTAALAKRVQ